MNRPCRVLLKVSGEILAGSKKNGIDPDAVNFISKEIACAHQEGFQIGIVVGAGNIVRGESASQLGISRANADYMGMLGTMINGVALSDGIGQTGISVRIQSAIHVKEISEPFIYRRAIRHMEKGRIVVLVGGTGNPYFTTDTAAALRATELGCDWLLKATKVDGVYSQDPEKFTNAERYKSLSYTELLRNPNIKVIDRTAITLCQENNMPLRIFRLLTPGNIVRAVRNEDVGTVIR